MKVRKYLIYLFLFFGLPIPWMNLTAGNNEATTCLACTLTYPKAVYCQNETDPTPTVVGTSGGGFASVNAGLIINNTTGVVDVSATPPGTYRVIYAAPIFPPDTCGFNITIVANASASIAYPQDTICQSDPGPLPTLTGTGGGVFSTSAPGLVLADTMTGLLDPASSSPGTYFVYYTAGGSTCGARDSFQITLEQGSDASFTFADSAFCKFDPNPFPSSITTPGGTFGSSSGILAFAFDPNTGEIDLQASFPGVYWMTYTTPGACPGKDSIRIYIGGTLATISQSGDTLTSSPGGSYQWLLNGSPISGATSQQYIAQTTGGYAVIISDSVGCADTSATTNVIVSITHPSLENFSWTYARTNGGDAIQIVMDHQMKGTGKLSLWSPNGSKLWEGELHMQAGKQSLPLDVAPYAKGIYFLSLETNQGRAVMRIPVF